MQPSQSPLLAIVAHARSGALDHAWRQFEAGGFAAVDDDPAVLSVRGRLLKDRAVAAEDDERPTYYREAAEAYGRAGELGGTATYPFINAATLSLLAGDEAGARAMATRVLELIERGEDGPETPYFREATRAEALLLLGRRDEARDSLAAAMKLAPRAWEDHATTLRQFALILAARGEETAWLDPMRPPRSLHFAGHMDVAADDEALAGEVRAVVEREGVGFGYGALAAGADIVVAEVLLDHGAELHLVLPAGPAAFRTASIAPWGEAWERRFEEVVERADSVTIVGSPFEIPDQTGNQLAAEAAMGLAVMQARNLTTEAVQLLVLDGDEADASRVGGSAWVGSVWREAGRRQDVLIAPREDGRRAEPRPAPSTALAALVLIQTSGMGAAAWADTEPLVEKILPRLQETIAALPVKPDTVRWRSDGLMLEFPAPAPAATAALAVAEGLRDIAGFRIAGHYGVVRKTKDPFGGPKLLLGPAGNLAGRILASVPPGAVHLSGDFAAALHAGPSSDIGRTDYVGDLQIDESEDLRLFSLAR